jgi:hypothetical protein
MAVVVLSSLFIYKYVLKTIENLFVIALKVSETSKKVPSLYSLRRFKIFLNTYISI